ncbi:hypothetical protein EGJ53_17485 [Pseudomonas fluorescens]|nr:hypothetical protein EGJ53_17485 [Pseudomonas fluorescens]
MLTDTAHSRAGSLPQVSSANSSACVGSHYHLIINLISERVPDHEFCLARAALPRKLALDEPPDPLRAGS